MSDITEIGKFLKKLRIERSMKMCEMAVQVGVTPSYLCSIESGGRELPCAFAKRLTKYLNAEFSGYDKQAYLRAIDLSITNHTLRLPRNAPDGVRLCVIAFSQKISAGSLTEAQCEHIMAVLARPANSQQSLAAQTH